MRIILKNGKKITGKSWEEVVQNLKNSTQFAHQSLKEYMVEAINRCQIFLGDRHRQIMANIDTITAESFLKELEEARIIKIEMEDK